MIIVNSIKDPNQNKYHTLIQAVGKKLVPEHLVQLTIRPEKEQITICLSITKNPESNMEIIREQLKCIRFEGLDNLTKYS